METMTAATRRQRADVMLWAAGVAWTGALAVLPAAFLLSLGLQVISVFAAAFSPWPGAASDPTGEIMALAMIVMGSCLVAALGCAWALSRAMSPAAPAWLVGSGSGLLGWAAGAAVAWLALSY